MSAKKKKKLAPLVSKRPMTQEEAAAPRKSSEAFGDVEMRIDHEELLRKNPIARLGYDPSKVEVIQKAVDNAYYNPETDKVGVFSAPRSKNYKTKIRTDQDKEEVINASELHSLDPNSYVHEFTHRGFSQLQEMYDEDPEYFKEKYGEDAVDALKVFEEEGIVELTDALDAPYLVGGYERDNRNFLNYSSERNIEEFQKGYTYDKRFKGLRGLFNAAEDMLKKRGEPEPAEHNPPNFFQRTLKRIGFDEGGEVMSIDRQMSLFEDGGLADDGMTREPVTGNEIPPGSMAKEVRDDVPAQLSEGEYVVPADVVRYYGVKFFEDLRQEAKGGMMDMEQEGRIGGTPVDGEGIPQDDPLTPEEKAALSELFPEQGYAEGGQVFSPTFTAGQVSPYGNYGAYGGSGFEGRQYVNTSTGQIRTFQFLNGKPVGLIPAGFVPATKEAIAAAEAATEAATETEGTGQATGQTEPEGRGFDPNKDTVSGGGSTQKDPTQPYGTGLGTTGTAAAAGLIGGALTGGLGGAVGFGKAGMQAGNFNEARNDLMDAVFSGDEDAINSATKAVETAYSEMGGLAKLGVFDEGKTGTQAAQNVTQRAQELMDKYNMQPGISTRNAILAAEQHEGWLANAPTPSKEYQAAIDANDRASANYGLTAEQASFAGENPENKSYGGMDESSAGYVDPYAEGYGPGGEGGGGGGPTVICTALHNLGRLDSNIYALDKAYGLALEKTNPELLQGYRKLATPLADYIQEDTLGAKVARELVTPFAKAWAKEMAHTLRPEEYKGSFLGKAIMFVGYPVCSFVGKKLKGVEYAV